ncbi:MAG: hypothetical protein O7E52_03475, partial [Candidatus Poribacteria bacterium]|nr:hypothetical protein [Candidatus Poribacteria bacterium]
MIKPPNLLDDRGMSQFIINGYVTVQADFPSGFHEQICRETDAVFEEEGDPRNHILAKVPALEQVFHHPALVKIGNSPDQSSQRAIEMAMPALHLAVRDPHEKVSYY